MLTIYAFREKGWFPDPNQEAKLWKHLSGTYGVECNLIETLAEIPDDQKLVIFDELGTTMLHSFEPPIDAAYIFGRTGQNLLLDLRSFRPISVQIATPKRAPLFGLTAAAIALNDRYHKVWQ